MSCEQIAALEWAIGELNEFGAPIEGASQTDELRRLCGVWFKRLTLPEEIVVHRTIDPNGSALYDRRTMRGWRGARLRDLFLEMFQVLAMEGERIMNLSPEQAVALWAMREYTAPDGKLCASSAYLADRADMADLTAARRAMDCLVSLGLAEFHALPNDRNVFAGAGYCITEAGRTAIREFGGEQ